LDEPEGPTEEEMSAAELTGRNGTVAEPDAEPDAERWAEPHVVFWIPTASCTSFGRHSAMRHEVDIAWKLASVQTQVTFVTTLQSDAAAAAPTQLAAHAVSPALVLAAGAEALPEALLLLVGVVLLAEPEAAAEPETAAEAEPEAEPEAD